MSKVFPSGTVVIKVGSQLLCSKNGVHTRFIHALARQIVSLRQNGWKVVIVSSGAIRCGERCFDFGGRRTRELQAAAAVGQPLLMQRYAEAFKKHNILVAQILLTRDVVSQRARQQNARNTMLTLIARQVVPIVNENDTVATEEIKAIRFGDNDILAAIVCTLVEAQALVILTDVDGFFVNGKLQGELEDPLSLIERAGGASFGFGGMRNKLLAASMMRRMGGHTFIAHGNKKEILTRMLDGEAIGTYIPPAKKRLPLKKCWIAFCAPKKGKIFINQGAKEALFRDKSLLPGGIVRVEGAFHAKENVHIVDEQGDKIGMGLTSYALSDLKAIAGKKTSEIPRVLGFSSGEEVIHKDNMVLLKELYD